MKLLKNYQSPKHRFLSILFSGEKDLTGGDWDDITPSFAPDGKSIIFASNRNDGWDIWRLWIADCGLRIADCKSEFDDAKLEQLTKGDDDELAPVYSPDGKEIAYLRNTKDEILNTIYG